MQNERSDEIYEELLILRCQAGDREAMTTMVRRWQPRLLEFATIVTRQPDIARDAVQDAWIAVIRGLPSLRDPAKYKGWILRIVHNKCIDHLRRTKQVEGKPMEEASASGGIDLLVHREQIAHILGELPESHRVVLALFYLHDLDLTEIASLLDIPTGTVKSRLHNARESFRLLTNQNGDTNEQPGPTDRPGAVRSGRLA